MLLLRWNLQANCSDETYILIRFRAVLKESQLILTLWPAAEAANRHSCSRDCPTVLQSHISAGLGSASWVCRTLQTSRAILRNVVIVISEACPNRLKPMMTLCLSPEWILNPVQTSLPSVQQASTLSILPSVRFGPRSESTEKQGPLFLSRLIVVSWLFFPYFN